MPISFEQPGPYSASISSAYGAAQAMRDFLPFLQRAYGGGGGGGGGTRGGGGGGMGISPAGDGSGGGGLIGGAGGGGYDPLALYQGRQEVDAYMREQERKKQIAAIEANTAGDPTAGDAQIEALQRRMSAGGGDTSESSGGDTNAAEAYNPAGGGDTSEAAPGTQTTTPESQGTAQDITPGSGEGEDFGGGGNIPQQAPQQMPQRPQPPPSPPEFSQADALQLQRLTASRAQVQAQLRSGMIDPGTARRMITQIQTGIDPLKQQQQAAQAAMQQIQLRSMQQQHAHQTAMEVTTNRMLSTANAEGIRQFGGVAHQWNHAKQEWVPMNEAAADRRAAAETAERTRQTTADAHGDTEFIRELGHVEKEVRGVSRDPLTEDQKKEVRERMLQRGFTSSDLNEHRANREQRRAGARIAGEVRQNMEREASSPNPPEWARTPAGREDEAWTRTQSRLRDAGIRGAAPAPQPIGDTPTASQRETSANFAALTRRLAQTPDSEGKNRDAAEIGRAQSLYARYGSTSAMPPSISRQVEGIVRRLNESLPAARRSNRAPAPGGATSNLSDFSRSLLENPAVR